MRFQYELTDVGWATGLIEVNSKKVEFVASYISDVLGDLTRSLICLLPSCVPFPYQKTSFVMCEEPEGTKWTFERTRGDQLSIQIVRYDDINLNENPDLQLHETCSLIEFATEVTKCLDCLLEKHGMDGYKKLWRNYDFPVKNYRLLKNFITTR